ncbi:WD-40 repeat protein [Reticulomyxa filosa]|uniref:WD-40 repeat protein n=1 Tax=Reticulomyxa filosa TaxID=46433 RepID=X6P0K4_RETFI|nr:WD-40 repeat protein [Reticulomyxa filosa]|eukprot:ETO31609.1 WD-40 repeat protein [Reticulomyxa filosa]
MNKSFLFRILKNLKSIAHTMEKQNIFSLVSQLYKKKVFIYTNTKKEKKVQKQPQVEIIERMLTVMNEKQTPTKLILLEEEQKKAENEIQIIIQHWIRIFNIKLGWIHNFDKIVINYTIFIFMLDTFRSSAKLINTFTGHTDTVWSIDYSTFDDHQLICSGSFDKTVCVWDMETNKQIQFFNGHSSPVYNVKFSSYHYYYHRRNVICSSSQDKTIRFWDIKDTQQLKILNGHTEDVYDIKFSPFNYGRYLCSGSYDTSIRLWDVETSKTLHIFNGHTKGVWCIDFSSLHSNNSNTNNSIGIIGGNGYTFCSGSYDATIRVWDIERTKQLIVLQGHRHWISSVKYGSNQSRNSGCENTILSGSHDNSVCLWDIRSGKQIEWFCRHEREVNAVEYSPFVVNNSKIGGSNVICSASNDNTIRFWDIRSSKKELYMIKGDTREDNRILCFKFLSLKANSGVYLCYGSYKGLIRVWG